MTSKCDEKRILRIARGAKGMDIYITLKGLDWDLQNPPSGYTYQFQIAVEGPSISFTIINSAISVANSNTISFPLNAYDAADQFYELGLYGMIVKAQKWTDPPGSDPEDQIPLEVNTCIYIYEKPQCPPPG